MIDDTEPDATDDDRRSTADPLPVGRRRVLATGAGLAGAGFASATLLTIGSEPAVAVEGDPTAFETGDAPTVRSNDGEVTAVFLSPEIVITWEDFGSGLDTIDLTLGVGAEAGVDEVYAEELLADGIGGVKTSSTGDIDAVTLPEEDSEGLETVDGTAVVELDRVDVTDRGDAVTSDLLSDEELQADETKTTTLDIVLHADVTGYEGEAESVTRTSTVDVVVENPDGDVDAGGEVEVDTE